MDFSLTAQLVLLLHIICERVCTNVRNLDLSLVQIKSPRMFAIEYCIEPGYVKITVSLRVMLTSTVTNLRDNIRCKAVLDLVH